MPVAIITEANAKHAPVPLALRRIVDNVWRPCDPQAGVCRLTDEKEVGPVSRFPGEMALGKTNGPSCGALVLALVHAPLAVGGMRLRGARPGCEESQESQQGDGQPQRPSYPHIRRQFRYRFDRAGFAPIVEYAVSLVAQPSSTYRAFPCNPASFLAFRMPGRLYILPRSGVTTTGATKIVTRIDIANSKGIEAQRSLTAASQ